jgi:hypothetical protein
VNPDTPTRRRPTALIAGIALGAALLVGATVAITLGLSGSPASTPAAGQSPVASTTAAEAPATTAAAVATSAPPPADAMLKFGTKADGPKATAVAYSWKQPVASKAPVPEQDGFEWGAADVELCVKVNVTIDRFNWRLTYADHTTIEPSGTGYEAFPAPAYPWGDRDLDAGQCIRGWITYAVPKGQWPATVAYQPTSMRGEWQVT